MRYLRLELLALVLLIIELVLGMSMTGFTQPRNNPAGFTNQGVAESAGEGHEHGMQSDQQNLKENLLKNPGFEEGIGNRPAWWAWSPNPNVKPGDFEVSWTGESHSGSKAVKIVAANRAVGGYWVSPLVPIEPMRSYHAEVYVKGTPGARVLFWLRGIARDGKTETMSERMFLNVPPEPSPLVTFVPEKALADPMPEKWTKMEKTFVVTRDTHYLVIWCGSYFGRGTIWIDDASLTCADTE